MGISRVSNAQFSAAKESEFVGVSLIYERTDKDGNSVMSTVWFDGPEYTAKDSSQNEVFRVWKNIVATFWYVKSKEAELKKDNGGIQSKLRATVPAAILVVAENGKCKRWDLSASVWQRIGLTPTKRDLEDCARDYKKKIHAAAKASFTALGFRVNFADIEKESEMAIVTPEVAAAV